MKRKRKLVTILLLISILLIGMSAIFLGIKLQQQNVAPEDIEAGGGNGACCDPKVGCVTGWKCEKKTCTEGAIGQYGPECPVGSGNHCKSGMTCNSSGKCTSPYTCVKNSGSDGGDCASTICEWPQVVVSGRCNSSVPVCHCAKCNGVSGCSNPSVNFTGCSGNPPTCNPGGCPAGTVSCGTTVQHETTTDCRKTAIKCKVNHPECNNASYIYRYCKPIGSVQSTITPIPTNTPTPIIIRTNTPTPTTPVVTNTPTTPVSTSTPTPTTPIATNTPTPTTPVATNTPTPTTPVATNTPTPTTPGVTNTPTPTSIYTPTITPTGPRLTITPSTTLPNTALINKTADRLIIGILMIFTGWTIYWFGLNSQIERVLWHKVGTPAIKKVKHLLFGKNKDFFEKKMRKVFDK